MNINFELYKYFFYVAKTTSVSKAANSLGVTQSAVSQAIKNLEWLLDKKLFLRTSKGMQLTNEGEFLYSYIRNGIRYFNDAEIKIRDLENKKKLVVATTPTLAKHFLFNKMGYLTNKNYDIEIKQF